MVAYQLQVIVDESHLSLCQFLPGRLCLSGCSRRLERGGNHSPSAMSEVGGGGVGVDHRRVGAIFKIGITASVFFV